MAEAEGTGERQELMGRWGICWVVWGGGGAGQGDVLMPRVAHNTARFWRWGGSGGGVRNH